MTLETRVEVLEAKHSNLDADVHSLARVMADIKNIVLTNQHDIAGLKVDIAGVKSDITCVKTCVAALAEATHAGFKRTDEQLNEFKQETRERFDAQDKRFDQLELLIRQIIPNTKN